LKTPIAFQRNDSAYTYKQKFPQLVCKQKCITIKLYMLQ